MSLNRFEVVETEPVKTLTSESVSVAAPVEASHEERVAAHQSLPTIVVPFFLIIAIAMGMAFYVHYVRASHRQDMLNQYAAENAWRKGAVAQFNSMQPLMLQLENVDPLKTQDWKHIQAIDTQLNKLIVKFTAGLSSSHNGSANGAAHFADAVLQSYEDDLATAQLPTTLSKNVAAKMSAEDLVATDVANTIPALITRAHGVPTVDVEARDRQARKIVSKMSNDELRSRVLKRLQHYPLWTRPRDMRVELQNLLINIPPLDDRSSDLSFLR